MQLLQCQWFLQLPFLTGQELQVVKNARIQYGNRYAILHTIIDKIIITSCVESLLETIYNAIENPVRNPNITYAHAELDSAIAPYTKSIVESY